MTPILPTSAFNINANALTIPQRKPMPSTPTYRKKLIEVDLPLDAINREASREKSIRHGHPSTLHLWWARRPLAACRAVIFASMVDDPSSCEDEYPTEEDQRKKRQELHDLIGELVIWKNLNNEVLLARARKEIAISVARSYRETAPETPQEVLHYLRDKAPTIYDPFCGGGSIPLEVQRLGLNAVGSDLNPVAVLITKALIELPPKFANQPPINPDADPLGMVTKPPTRSRRGTADSPARSRGEATDPPPRTQGEATNPPLRSRGGIKGGAPKRIPWRGAAGLADDIRYYGKWMRDKAFKRIGHLYPQATLPDGTKTNVIAWLWARTIPCANPACGIKMPMMKTFQLSKKSNNQHWLRPIIDRNAKSLSFQVQNHDRDVPKEGTVNRNGATCLACGNTVKLTYVREQAKAGNMGDQMTTVVAAGERKRLFISPDNRHTQAAHVDAPHWILTAKLPDKALGFAIQNYGSDEWHKLFTKRQLLVLNAFVDLVSETRSLIIQHGADEDYANALSTYLAFAQTKTSTRNCAYNRWDNTKDIVVGLFGRQAIPMIWDYAEANPFSSSNGSFLVAIDGIARNLEQFPLASIGGKSHQADARFTIYADHGPVIVTDPPYYDNIGYADLSDFFYVWLRPMLRDIFPDLFTGILTPKSEEMVAAPRFTKPKQWFEESLSRTLKLIRSRCTDDYPSSIFYAYKHDDEQLGGRTSTGWETMLSSIVSSGFQIVGTWPLRTELANRQRSLGSNALASSVVLVCRRRATDAPTCSRRQFLDELRTELPYKLRQLTHEGHIAPTDLAQAAIGPGMEIYSRYSSVRTISGKLVTVGDALDAINHAIEEWDEEQEGGFDAASRFCLQWLKQHRFKPGEFGAAQTLANAKNTIVDNLANVHRLLRSGDGIVQLVSLDEFNPDRPFPNAPMTAWEGCMRIAYNMDGKREDAGATQGSAEVAHRMGSNAESVERLARVLYNYFDGRGEAGTALLFNELVTSWSEIQAKANEIVTARQTSF